MTIYRVTLGKQIEEMKVNSKNIKSKVQFQGNFHEELEEIIEIIQNEIQKKIIPNYGVVYTEYGSQNMKIKIKDSNLMIEKLISCNFFYKKNDEKYGYITPQFSSAELGQRTKTHVLEKYTISDHDIIVNAFMEKLVEIIEEF
jgi:hypothetical protein